MIENRNSDDFKLACIGCGTKNYLMQVAHRNSSGFIVGYVFLCDECQPIIGGKYKVSLVEAQVGEAEKGVT